LTLGPLRRTPTISSLPTTWKIQPGAGWYEGIDNLFVYGNGASSDDEPMFLFNGSTTTWTDCTINADLGGDITKITGVTQVEATIYAISDQLVSNGSANHILYQSTNGTTWAETTNTGTAETLAGSMDRLSFLQGWEDDVIAVAWLSTTGGWLIFGRDTQAATTQWTNYFNSGEPPTEQTSEPRGFIKAPGPDGALDVFVSNNRGLHWLDTSLSNPPWRIVHKYRNTNSIHTGHIVLAENGKIFFTDGPNVGEWYWVDGSGNSRVDYIGPHSLSVVNVAWDGVPIEKTGDVVALAVSTAQPWIYAAIGGLAASRNAWVGVYDWVRGQWHNPYRGATAQRAVRGLFESNENDDVNRLHLAEENAAGGDQDLVDFTNIITRPDTDASYQYASSGFVFDTRFDGFTPLLQKGFYQWRTYGDDFTSNEKVDLRFAVNGAAFSGSVQSITSSPGSVWTDGSSTALGTDALDISSEITLNRGGTSTNSPKVFAMGYEYDPKALKDDLTPLFIWEAVISRNPDDYRSANLRPETVLSNLETSFAKRTLLNLAFDEGDNTSVSAKVKMLPFSIEQTPDSRGRRGAIKETATSPIRVTLVEVI
jgi:hypothetical protein